jgi:hypothetical protein
MHGGEVEPRDRIALARAVGGAALEISQDVVYTRNALALRIRLLLEQLAQHALRSILHGQRHQRQEVHHAEDLVLILAREALDCPHEPQNVVGYGHNGFLFLIAQWQRSLVAKGPAAVCQVPDSSSEKELNRDLCHVVDRMFAAILQR